MKLNAPKQITWLVYLIIAIIAIIGKWIVAISFVSPNAFLILLIAFIILWLGTFIKGF